MSFIQIFCIVIGIVYLLLLIMIGLLAYKYSKKHKPFLEIRDEYFVKWKAQKQKINLLDLFKPLKSKLELPIGETLYFLEDEIFTYLANKKSDDYKFIFKTADDKIMAFDSYYDDEDFISLKSIYRIRNFNQFGFTYHGMLYITNQRLIFTNNDQYIQIPLTKVIKSYVAVIRVGANYSPGYIIQTQDQLYQIVSEHPEVTVIINELKRYQIHQQTIEEEK